VVTCCYSSLFGPSIEAGDSVEGKGKRAWDSFMLTIYVEGFLTPTVTIYISEGSSLLG
jgi:hypothetical protein